VPVINRAAESPFSSFTTTATAALVYAKLMIAAAILPSLRKRHPAGKSGGSSESEGLVSTTQVSLCRRLTS
jgi:hypothetical protein